MLENIWKWAVENKEWAFSGIGVTVVMGIIGMFKFSNRKKVSDSNYKLTQKNSFGSKGTQIGIQNNYGGKKND